MSASSSEPEKYTLDEMMDRLKNKGSSEDPGELVVREDGSQAVRIKKRRRRTNQAVNEETKRNSRVQIIQIAGFVVLIVLAGLAFGIGIIYANSKGYRERLVEKLETSSGAEVALSQFRMNPSTANANAVSLVWPEGNALAKLELGGTVAKTFPASFLGKSFTGEEIVSDKGVLSLRVPQGGEPTRFKSGGGEILPVKFQRYFLPQLNVFFGDGKDPARMFEKTEASFYPGGVPGQADLRLNGGLIKMPGWPQFELDRAYIQARGGELQVVTMRFFSQGDEKGSFDLSGSIRPMESDATHALAVAVENFRLSQLVGADLGRFFSGRVDTKPVPESNFLTFRPGGAESATLNLSLGHSLASRIDLGAFKFLGGLSLTLEDRWFELPVFDDDAAMTLVRRGADIELRELQLTSRGRMALRGNLSIRANGELNGKLRVGVADTMVASSPARRLDAMFSPVREGFRWIDLEIGGTSAAPEDNFAALYEGAGAAAVAPEPGPSEAVPDSFEDLIETR